MMSKETYDYICADINRKLSKIDDDYKDHKKKEEYKNRQESKNLIKEIQTE
ncbi:MAG: hypothetical protein ACN23H_01095 [Candidatus Phytoplasma vitis]|nr:MAG: hypothetical protein M6G77_00970 [Candidatus Phytoplasma vitis]